jgi:DNA-binding transcriptional LysR family regulator
MADLDLLRSFLGIYRAGTISAAAQHLGFTQPALSQHLKALEAQLGRPLFNRLPRGLAPTPVAHALAQNLGSHMDAMVATIEAARAGTDHIPGPLHLGGPAEFLGAKVFPTLCLCTLWQSGIQLRVQTGAPGELLEALKAGTLDLLITPQKASQRGVKFEPLFEERFVLVGAPRWAARMDLRAIQAQGSAAFEGFPVLVCGDEFRRYFQSVFGAEPDVVPSLVVDDLRAAMAAAIGGMGIAVLPRHLCEDALRRGELVQLHHAKEPQTNTVYLACKTTLRPNPRLSLVWDLIRKSAEAW